ncbi:uncharacterized protein RAG0_09987 [Rhynchosporium agropyri]|uniref:Uncharacterized protein n=1 Tax=Rhynchosporium agropyri TaxID=914238 RepID=A0A1E1L0U2_9HELO|nr:uncharacterized protein RAG0_09987 [Rhynchosporium agropyri]
MSSTNSNLPLSEAEEDEIRGYERIVAFAEEVMAGNHPRVKKPAHMLPASNTAQVSSTSAASSRSIIDFRRDYFKDLGIQQHVKQDSIIRAFKSKVNKIGSESKAGRTKLQYGNLTW